MASNAWGQLVSTTDVESEPLLISKATFVLGRTPACDVSFPGNKMVSGLHCKLERDGQGQVWIQDSSTNGTLINLSKKITKEKVPLHHGDEIHLVYRKMHEDSNIAFLFQDLEELRKEELAATTLEYMYDENEETDVPSSEPDPVVSMAKAEKKRTAESEPEEKPLEKKCKMEAPNLADKSESGGGDAPEACTADQENEKKEDTVGGEKAITAGARPEEEKDALEETLLCIICQEILHDCVSLQPCMHSFCGGCFSDWMARSDKCPSCRDKVVRICKNHLVNNLVEAYLKTHPEKKRPADELKELDNKNKITRDMLYSKEKAPREEDEEDDGELEVEYSYSDIDEDEEDDSYVDSSDSSSDGGIVLSPYGDVGRHARRPQQTVCRQCPTFKGSLVSVAAPPFTLAPHTIDVASADIQNMATSVAALFTSRTECRGEVPNPGNAAPRPSTSTGQQAGEGSSTSGEAGGVDVCRPHVRTIPIPPPFICRPGQTHTLCQCCLQPMPDRRADHLKSPNTIPPSQCLRCYRTYCHAYWGCRRVDCRGCIGRFRDIDFGDKVLDSIILNNQYESEVFKNYLKLKKLTVRDLLQLCLEKVGTGDYQTGGHGLLAVDSQSVLCYKCGLEIFRDLAYQYRKNITPKELPDGVRYKQDCYWGRNCRTQRKLHHAVRFNHVCEQTMNPGRLLRDVRPHQQDESSPPCSVSP